MISFKISPCASKTTYKSLVPCIGVKSKKSYNSKFSRPQPFRILLRNFLLKQSSVDGWCSVPMTLVRWLISNQQKMSSKTISPAFLAFLVCLTTCIFIEIDLYALMTTNHPRMANYARSRKEGGGGMGADGGKGRGAAVH